METIESQIYEIGRYISPIPPLQSNKLKRFQIDYKTTCGKEERQTFLSDH